MDFSRGALGGQSGDRSRSREEKEKKTQSSEAETSTTMSFGVFGAGDTVGSVREDVVREGEEGERQVKTGAKLRKLLGTSELSGNVGPSKSEEDLDRFQVSGGGGRDMQAVEMGRRNKAAESGVVSSQRDIGRNGAEVGTTECA